MWTWFPVQASLPEDAVRPTPQHRGKQKAERWGASLTACQGSYPKFPGAQDTPDQTRALTSSGCPSARCRAAGKTSCVPHSLSLPLSPPLLQVRRSHSSQSRFGEGWGGAAGLGRRQGCFYQKEITVTFETAPPSSAASERPLLFLSLHRPLPLFCPHLHLIRVWPVHGLGVRGSPPQRSPAPLLAPYG